MEDRELLQKSDPEFDRLAFTVLAIEASAQKMGISPSEMRKRLDKVGLIKSLIQDCYDTLHTESREAVANDVVKLLKIGKEKNNGKAVQIIRKGIIMLDFLLWNKIARIIKQLADTLHISTDRALQIFYDSDVCRMLHDKELGLHLMSDTYIVNDLIEELRNKQ